MLSKKTNRLGIKGGGEAWSPEQRKTCLLDVAVRCYRSSRENPACGAWMHVTHEVRAEGSVAWRRCVACRAPIDNNKRNMIDASKQGMKTESEKIHSLPK